MIKTVEELIDRLQCFEPEAEICALDPEGHTTFYLEQQVWIESDGSGVILYLKRVTL